ncbi:putative cytoplasmic protein [Klebsiella aerogenes]|nr:putative cytoplasmic protein [Klebsiella aerogenes]
MVLNVHIEALFWCIISIMVQSFCTMVRMIQRFTVLLKVGTDFALYFLRQQRHF